MSSLFKSPKPPKPIDVGAVTQQAKVQNTGNAYENAAFNRVNQTDQFGNTLKYAQTGVDAQGNPIFNATQGMGETAQKFAGGFSGLGQKYLDTAGAAPESSSAALDRAYDMATSFSAPRQERQTAAMDTKLLNAGLDPSSEAYRNRMRDLTENQSSANNTLAAALQGQVFNQGLAGRQQQMSELAPGVNFAASTINPNLVNAPQVGVQNVDVAGLHGQNYAQQMEAYKANQAKQGAMLGGLGAIGGAIAKPLTGYMLG